MIGFTKPLATTNHRNCQPAYLPTGPFSFGPLTPWKIFVLFETSLSYFSFLFIPLNFTANSLFLLVVNYLILAMSCFSLASTWTFQLFLPLTSTAIPKLSIEKRGLELESFMVAYLNVFQWWQLRGP